MLKQANSLVIVFLLFLSTSAFASLSFIDPYYTLSSGGKPHVKKLKKKSSKRTFSRKVRRTHKHKKVASRSNTSKAAQKATSLSSLVCMARNIYFEAGIESTKGKIAVANVTMNRVRSKHYPKSVCDVVYQKNRRTCAFSWTCDRKSNTPPNNRIYEESMQIARLALSGALKDVTGEADHYHATYVKPSWSMEMEQKTKIGRHVFYKQYRS